MTRWIDDSSAAAHKSPSQSPAQGGIALGVGGLPLLEEKTTKGKKVPKDLCQELLLSGYSGYIFSSYITAAGPI